MGMLLSFRPWISNTGTLAAATIPSGEICSKFSLYFHLA
jgi:hypothetical protein